MTTHEAKLWQDGVTDAPLPPLADPKDMAVRHPLLALYRKLGPIFRIPNPDKPLVVLAGPEANTFVARYENEFFVTRDQWDEFDAALNNDRMNSARDGDANRQRRAQASRSYSRARVLDQIPRMIEITLENTQDWQPGKSIVVRPSMQRIVSEQLGQLLVRHGPGEYLEDFITYLDMTISATFNKTNAAALQSPEYLHARDRAYELGRIIYEEHLNVAEASTKPDLLDDILEHARQHPELYSEEALSRAGIGPFLAGIDTVANTSSFMIYALLKNTGALERVLAEVDAAFADGELSWEKLKAMQALHGAAMETLRLYPVAGSHMMRAAKPLTYAGYRIEPGDRVMLAMTVPHFMEELYPKPEEFDIDRFHDPRNEHRQRGAYAPFSIGDHTCLGAGIAEIQLMVTIAILLHTYRLEFDPLDYQLTIEHMPTLAPGGNFSVKVLAKR